MVRDGVHPTPVTLAIGDGANDVGMIQVRSACFVHPLCKWDCACNATRCAAATRCGDRCTAGSALGRRHLRQRGAAGKPALSRPRLAWHRAVLRRPCCKLGSCVLQTRIVRVATAAGGERVGLCDRAVCVPQTAAARARPLELRAHVHDHQVSEAVPNHTLRPRPRARRTRTRTHRSDWRAAVGAASACGRTALAHGVRRYVVYKNFVIALTMFFFGFWCRNVARCIRRQLSLARRNSFGCTHCRTRRGQGRRAFLQPARPTAAGAASPARRTTRT